MYFPGLAILFKLPLVLPCISNYLDKIRGGYERRKKPTTTYYNKNKVESA